MVQQNTIIPWLRKLVITLGPLEEYKNAAEGNIIQFVSDGTQNGLRAVCNINKTVQGMPSPSTINIYNLSRDTRNGIQRTLTKVTVEAGWENTELHKVFQGSVMSVTSERQGSDIVSKLTCLQGYGSLARSIASVSYAGGLPVASAVKDLGGRLEGVTINDANLKDVEGTFGAGGWSFAGSTKDALTELSNEYGFSWTIDDGALQAVGDKAVFNGQVVLDGNEGGLFLAAPTLQGPMQIQTGIKIKALYVPGVRPGATVKLQSALDEGLNGTYRIHTANFNLDAYTDAWTMDLEALTPRRSLL